MDRYTNEQCLQIVQLFYRNSRSYIQTQRALREFYEPSNRPNKQVIRRIVEGLEENFYLQTVTTPVRERRVRSGANIAAASASAADELNLSIQRRIQELGTDLNSSWKILRKSLGLKTYKIQLKQELMPSDHKRRVIFSEWASAELNIDRFSYRKIIFSGEANFWLNGCVEKHNMRYLDKQNPHEFLKVALHPEKLTVWCAFHAGGVIGPFFFKNERGKNVDVDKIRYRAMLNEFFFPKTAGFFDMWFQQDGATCHTARETRDLLRKQFDGMIISRLHNVSWPARSCDLTPCDFFLWGYLKSLVYANKPQTIEDLQVNIEQVIADIPADLCENVAKHWVDRINFVEKAQGTHMKEVLFKI